ncbi:LysR family transcriptional regulator [Moritella sp. 36]|uniref:LysR substrate-binding domain-containing protein n=1 Tax=Moritella sp. 36 TaxID=2746233 RepID=UPI001BA8F5AB|nr:LysR substrate-binding domain-containing protein [Moritella sp. 36]QUM91172.1 LysR family transcriptional regulator [Moritella sp. 36]
MNLDNLAKIDLNLLAILQILLEEESVTRAAHRLHLSQSALSKSLNRLRDTLGDPLFLRTAHGLKPTAHALQLKAQLPTILQGLYHLCLPPSFIPENSHRQFSFAMLESAYETLLPHYIGPILSQAPKLNLGIYDWNEKSLLDLQQGQIDFGITARELHPTADVRLNNLPEGIAHQRLFTDNQVCLIRENHPMLASINAGHWDVDAYLSMSHVQVRCEGNDWWLLDYQLAESGLHRHICATLPDFYGAASVCAHSDLIFTLPSSFVSHTQKLYGLVELPLPIDFSSLVYVLLWHERNNDEPGHKWVRDTICQSVAKEMG